MSARTPFSIAAVVVALLLLIAAGVSAQQRGGGFTQPEPIAFDDHEGWTSIFDGTLKNWEGNPEIWTLENGVIVGTSTPAKPSGTTYIIWKGGEP